MNAKDLTNIRFGKLIAIKYVKSINKLRHWLCKCDCGGEKIVSSKCLLRNQTRSCGCESHYKNKAHKNWKGYEDIPLDFFSNIKRSAESRNIEFNITIEYLWNLLLRQNKKCALSGIDLSFSETRKNKDKSKTVSVDRIDSSKGYIEGNVQWVHKTINIMKNSLRDEEFIEFCKKVTEYNKK